MASETFLIAVFSLTCVLIGLPMIVGSSDEEEKRQYVEEETKKITKELIVPTNNLSSTARKKESATDDRPSAQNVGYLGVTMLCMAAVIIVVMDANYISQILQIFKRKDA